MRESENGRERGRVRDEGRERAREYGRVRAQPTIDAGSKKTELRQNAVKTDGEKGGKRKDDLIGRELKPESDIEHMRLRKENCFALLYCFVYDKPSTISPFHYLSLSGLGGSCLVSECRFGDGKFKTRAPMLYFCLPLACTRPSSCFQAH